MKDTFYFPHDYHSRNDPRIIRLIKTGWDHYGLYWAIIEMLHEQGGYLLIDFHHIAYELRTNYERIENVIINYELFTVEKDRFYSKRVLDNLIKRKEKSHKARESIQKRWLKYTNVLPTNYEGNTIKERKGKERKHTVFTPPSVEEVQKYCEERGNSIDSEAFISYYTARGWQFKVGQPIKSWKSCIITWEKRRASEPKNDIMEGFR